MCRSMRIYMLAWSLSCLHDVKDIIIVPLCTLIRILVCRVFRGGLPMTEQSGQPDLYVNQYQNRCKQTHCGSIHCARNLSTNLTSPLEIEYNRLKNRQISTIRMCGIVTESCKDYYKSLHFFDEPRWHLLL